MKDLTEKIKKYLLEQDRYIDVTLTRKGKYAKFNRQKDKFGAGIDVTWGVLPDGGAEAHQVHFDKDKFSKSDVTSWLKRKKKKALKVESETITEDKIIKLKSGEAARKELNKQKVSFDDESLMRGIDGLSTNLKSKDYGINFWKKGKVVAQFDDITKKLTIFSKPLEPGK